ncbi:MAG TPA: serine/threonine protein kinase [Firmicutes bacterium]|jgi:hypothetical protein|nr:serine/threonine protein kinase [Bacillota bacterium]
MSQSLPGLNRYVIKSKLGEGGFGQVYYSWDRQLNRETAVKVLENNRLALTEAQILAGFDHPNIVKLYDVVSSGSALYLVMEFVPGPTLLEQKLDLDQILDVGIQCCEALDAVHQRGLVHLDVKPHNLLYDPKTNTCKLTDFGAAARRQLKDKQIVGTPKYIAPEQRQGQAVDARADLYALAKVLGELIEVNQISQVPGSLKKLLNEAGSADINQRPRTASELQRKLISVKAGWLADLRAERERLRRVKELVIDNYPLLTACFNALLAGAVLWTLWQQPVLRALDFYDPVFKQFMGPAAAVLVGFISPALACLLIAVLVLLPLWQVWPGLALVCGLILLILAGKIYRYPGLSLMIALTAVWMPGFPWLLPVLVGYFRSAGAAVGGGLALGFAAYFINCIQHTQAYQSLKFIPLGFDSALIAAEIYEVLGLGVDWLFDPSFGLTLQGVLMGLGARWIGSRGTLGMVLYLLSTAAAVFIIDPDLIWQWGGIMLILCGAIWVHDLFLEDEPTQQLQTRETEIVPNKF